MCVSIAEITVLRLMWGSLLNRSKVIFVNYKAAPVLLVKNRGCIFDRG
jgi:hypothetical protein